MGGAILSFPLAEFFGGGLLVILLVPGIRAWAHGRQLLDVPTEDRKIHQVAVPRLGGVAIYGAFLAIFATTTLLLRSDVRELDGWEQMFWVVTLMFTLGVVDDFHPLGAKRKLAGQIAIALLAYWMGLRVENLTNPLDHTSHMVGAWGIPLTVLWIVAITNLINLIDGLDGLAAGVGIFLMVVLAVLAGLKLSLPMLALAAGIIGALAGFLFFNFPPAKIFLGDGGAYFLGSLIASMALVSSSKGEVVVAMVVPFFALGLPILDAALAILRRGILGLPIFRGDRQHIHHRLLDMGFSQRRSVLFLYLFCAFLCLAAGVFALLGSRWWPLSLGVVFTVGLFAVRGFGYVKSWEQIGLQLAGSVEKRRVSHKAQLLSRILVLEAAEYRDWADFRAGLGEILEKLRFHSFKLESSIEDMRSFEWKPAHARPWNLESDEAVEQRRSIRNGREILGTLRFFSYVDENNLDHFHRIADVVGESIEEAFNLCAQRWR